MTRENRMLDEVDIINDRLNKEINKLEEELSALKNRHEITHANLEQVRNQLKANQELEARLTRLQKNHDTILRCLTSIANGSTDPMELAKRTLRDFE